MTNFIMMNLYLWFLFFTIFHACYATNKELYLITTPNILLSESNHKFNIYVSVHVSLIIETVHPESKITNRTDRFVLESGIHSIPYFIPFVGRHVGPSLELNFLADNCSTIDECSSLTEIEGLFIKEKRKIDILIDNFIIFTETDKPIYKPGDLVRFRAMAIYPTNLLSEPMYIGPYTEILLSDGVYSSVPTVRSRLSNFKSITIQTPENVKMDQWKNVSFDNAMRLGFRLSNDPVFGQWKITTIIGSLKEITSFTVKKYVLPRFVVDLNLPQAILLSDKNITFQVCSSYSTGKYMEALIKGELCVTIRRKICRAFASLHRATSKCKEIILNATLFGLDGKQKIYSSTMSFVTVTVTENGTTNSVTKNATGAPIKSTLYEILFKSKEYFKPGLPYFGKLKLQRHDGNPQQNSTVVISIDGNYLIKWGFRQNYSSNNAGIINFVIPYIPVSSKLSIVVQGEQDNKSSVLTAPKIYKVISNWESVDNEYLQILTVKKRIQCPGAVKLKLLTNGDVSAIIIYAQMISRGVINKILEFPPVPVKCADRNDHIGHYTCASYNQLKCLERWKGSNCREPVCKGECINGVCIRPYVCQCKMGWAGANCERCLMASYCVNGYCTYGNDCQCLPGWKGYKCDQKGPIIHELITKPSPTITTVAPIPEPFYQNQTIFERFVDIPLDKNMGPDLHIVLYYINKNNEIIADSIEITKGLTNCSHLGGGKFKFNKKTASPGEVVKLSLNPKTAKKSCALRISDVALSQFGQSSNINLGYLINKLTELNHKMVNQDVRGQDKSICLSGRSKRRSLIWPGVGQGYDSRKTFAQSGLTVITNGRIINAKCRIHLARNYDRRYLADEMASPPNYNRKIRNDEIKKKNYKEINKEIKKQIREFFPETWIFDYYNSTQSLFNLTVPDSITTWKANSFCMTEKGVWIAPTRYLTVILPFFTDIYVPYSIKVGEKLQLPVKVFNYVDDCYEIKAEIQVNGIEIKISGPTAFTLCVCTNDVKTIYFNIEAKVMGKLNITVTAESKYSSFCSNGSRNNKKVNLFDAIRRQILVEPPGIPAETTFSELICNNNESLGQKAAYNIPTNIVPGSLRSYLIYNGDIMGQTFDNLDRLVRMPYGCGEQNMVALVPSISVQDYLISLNIDNPNLMEKTKKYITEGFRRQLTYKHDDGSYSAFGKNDKSGNTWLTAFVLQAYNDAIKHLKTYEESMNESVKYLEKMQSLNGCFNENGKLLSNSMAGGLKNKGKIDESLLTAYVLISLKNIKTTLNKTKAINCIKIGINSTSSSYGFALLGYALSIYEPQSLFTENVIRKLQNMSTDSGRYRFWKSGLDSSASNSLVNSADIETTGYALLAVENFQSEYDSFKTIYWLSNKRNSLGGYYSTQDTIIALKAISVFAKKMGVSSFEKVGLEVLLENIKHSDLLTEENRLVTRKISIGSMNISYIAIRTNGTGCTSIQLVSLYNIEKLYSAKEEFKIDVKSSLTDPLSCTNLEVTVCSSYLRKDKNSNMILITIDFPSGWELSSAEKNSLSKQIIEPLKRIDFLKDKIHLYYDSFSYIEDDNERCFTIRLHQTSKIDNLKASFIRMVDYYKPEIYTDTSYEVPMKTCQITNSTKPKPSKLVTCPKCVEYTDESVTDFQSRMCPWSFSGLVIAGNKTLKDRLFYEPKYQLFYEWTVDIEPANCSCLKSWDNINEAFIVLSSEWISLNDKLTFTNSSVLYPTSVFYKAFKSDLSKSCSTANQLSLMMSRILPDFKEKTEINETCPTCILLSNLYYKVSNISTFICSNYTRWAFSVDSVNSSQVIGSLSNNLNNTIFVIVTFPMSSCFCLRKLEKMDSTFEIIDINNFLEINNSTVNEPLNLVLDNNFEIVESKVFTTNKNVECKN